MAIQPITFYDQFSRPIPSGVGNKLIRAATQSTDRKQLPMLDADTHRNLSAHGRRVLLTIGRYLYQNFPAVKGAIDEQADLAVSTFLPQFYGADKAWGAQAEAWLYEWAKVCNVAGWPYDQGDLMRHLIIGALVDGDIGIVLTEGESKFPQVQVIRAHRIGGASLEADLFQGGSLIDGAYVDPIGRATGYAIVEGGNYANKIVHRISSRDMLLTFMPDNPDQVRGFSALASAAFDWQDVYERRQFELIAQKVGASIALIEKNEEGTTDSTRTLFQNATEDNHDDDDNVDNLHRQEFDGGLIRYFRSGSGAGLEAFRNDRPSSDAMAHEMEIVRSAMAGMNWSIDFSLDPTKAGGASMRIVVDKVNRRLDKLRAVVAKTMRRVHGWALSKAIVNGDLPENPDWWKWVYQGPAALTSDKKYDSAVSLSEIKMGLGTWQDECAKRGLFWEEVQDANIEYLKRLKEKCDAAGVPFEHALQLTPNGTIPTATTAPATDEDDE